MPATTETGLVFSNPGESDSILERLSRSPSEMKAAKENEGEEADADSFTPITAAEMRGDPVKAKVGFLDCSFKPLVRREVREFSELFASLPEIVQFAVADTSETSGGINVTRTAEIMTAFAKRVFGDSEAEREQEAKAAGSPFTKNPPPVDITPFDVTEAIADTNYTLDSMDDTLWKMVQMFTKDTMPELTQETFTEKVLDELNLHGYCDLVRSLKSALGGFRGSFADRFFRRNNG